MAISKGAVIKLILKYIGGNPLMQIPTTTVSGQPVAIQAGLGGVVSSTVQQTASLVSQAAGLSAQLTSLSSSIGAVDLVGQFSSVTDSLTGGQLSSLTDVTSQVSGLSGLTSQLTNFASAALDSGALNTEQILAADQILGLTRQISSISTELNGLSSTSGSVSGLTQLAQDIGNYSGGLQQGLSLASQNPLSTVYNSTSSTLSSFTQNSYSGLDSQLPNIASNPSLSGAYNALKASLGGSDGLTGAVSQLNSYKEHTDRLSGITLSSESDYYASQESGSEYVYYYDLPLNTWKDVISFSAKTFRSAKYFIQGTSNNEHQSSEIFVIHDNIRVYTREVDQIYTTDPFITFTSQFTDNTVKILANTALPNTDLVIYGIKLEVATKASSKDTITQEKILESAKSMAGFYPSDTTDYIELQASSLLKPNSMYLLQDSVENLVERMTHYTFESLSTADKEKYIRDYANSINTLTTTMQNSIDSDIAAHEDITKKIESASVVYGISSSYSDPKAKRLLDLTLKDDVKTNLK